MIKVYKENELRTLENFLKWEKHSCGSCREAYMDRESIELLRQEAVKWIKNRQKRIKELNKSVETHQREMWISQNEAVITTFKTFFNITKGDLK